MDVSTTAYLQHLQHLCSPRELAQKTQQDASGAGTYYHLLQYSYMYMYLKK